MAMDTPIFLHKSGITADMNRRRLLAAAGTGLIMTIAGCLGDDDDDTGRTGEFPTLSDVSLTVAAADIDGEVGVIRQFSPDQTAGIWTRLTNVGSSPVTFEFSGFASPFFYEAVHQTDDEASLVVTDEINSPNDPPMEPIDGCWTVGYPPRPPTTHTKELVDGASLTNLYFLAQPTTVETDECLPSGTYQSHYELAVAGRDTPINLTLAIELNGDEE